MRPRDPRYDLIKAMIVDGKITCFRHIFKYVPKSVVSKDLGKRVSRFNRAMNHIDEFKLQELFRIAKLCNLEEWEITKLAVNEYVQKKNQPIKSNTSEIP